MSLAHKIFTNTFWQVLIRALNILIGVFNLALITRILGQTGFGHYTTIFAFLQTMMILVDLGLYLSLLREISTVEDRASETKVTNNIFTIRLISSLVVLIASPALVLFLPYGAAVKQGTLFFALAFFFQSLISTLTAVFSKKLAMPRAVLVDFFSKFLFLIGLFYLFYAGADLNLILMLHSGVYALSFILFYGLLRKYVNLGLAWDWPYWRRVLQQSWPLAVTVVLNLLYFKADTLILSAFRSPEEVALYGAPYRVLEVLATFPHMFMSLLLPLLTTSWLKGDQQSFRKFSQHSFDFFILLVLPMMAISWLFGKKLMILLAGPGFAASGPILNILILATASIFFGTLFTYLVVALGAQKEMIKYFLLTALIALVGYFFFIPRYSYWGAAYMTVLVELLMVVFAAWLVHRKLKLGLDYRILKKGLGAVLFMSLVLWFFRSAALWWAIPLALLIYAAGLCALKVVDKSWFNIMLNRK